MKWTFFGIGLIAQVLCVICMKLSCGYTKPMPSIFIYVFWAIAHTIFIFALKDFDVGYAFALFSGGGIVLVSILGVFYFGEHLTPLKVICTISIALGAAGLSMGR